MNKKTWLLLVLCLILGSCGNERTIEGALFGSGEQISSNSNSKQEEVTFEKAMEIIDDIYNHPSIELDQLYYSKTNRVTSSGKTTRTTETTEMIVSQNYFHKESMNDSKKTTEEVWLFSDGSITYYAVSGENQNTSTKYYMTVSSENVSKIFAQLSQSVRGTYQLSLSSSLVKTRIQTQFGILTENEDNIKYYSDSNGSLKISKTEKNETLSSENVLEYKNYLFSSSLQTTKRTANGKESENSTSISARFKGISSSKPNLSGFAFKGTY